jgi:hypothetical protein
VPYALNQVPKVEFRNAVSRLEMDFNMSTVNGPLIQWLINGSDTRIDWSKPTLEYVQNGNYTFDIALLLSLLVIIDYNLILESIVLEL